MKEATHSHEDGKNKMHAMNMGNRGVTRMMHENGGQMNKEERMQMLHTHHAQTLWIYWTIIILGIWLILSPLTFSYAKETVQPGGGREVWLSLQNRIAAMKWSDIISGAMLVILGFRSLTPNRPVSAWICCFTGIWLSFAPLIFWAPSAHIYLNDTFIGMLVISLSILIPGMPNMLMYMKMGSETPQGWTYNPSSWAQRWIMIVTGFLGFVVSRYLAAFQLGYIDAVWDPFFGNSSERVLNSAMSHSLIVSDAGLGALAYTFEFLMGFMGSPSRWRTMPWMVAFFGILVIPLGLVHIFLVISQPIAVGAWCTFCLAAAAIMLPMIPLEVDEVVAMLQHTIQATRKGEKFWNVFWKGGSPMEMNQDERSPHLMQLPKHFGKILKASVWGMSAPWTLIVTTLIGAIVMAIPGFTGLPIQSAMADLHHLCGALIIVIAIISMGEVVRMLRYLNVVAGLALMIITWLIDDAQTTLQIADTVTGIIICFLSFPRGIKKEQYGLWDKYIV